MRPGVRAGIARAAAFLRVVPGAVLAVSGYLKAVRPAAEFAVVLESYWIFPGALIQPMARVIPWVELLAGLALMLGLFTRLSAAVAAALFASFVAVLAQAIHRKLPMDDCGCFGRLGPHLLPAQSLGLDAVLLAICLLVIFEGERRWSLDRWIAR